MTTRRANLLVAASITAVAVLAGLVVTWVLFPTRIVPHNAQVPMLRGATLEDAVARLSALGLRARMAASLPDPLTPRGTISWQSPPSGTVLPEGTVVRLGASTGPPLVVVPDVAELDLTTAQRVIEAAGLKYGALDSEWSNVPLGIVLRTRPAARTALRAGSAVQVTVSRGPQEVTRDSTNRP